MPLFPSPFPSFLPSPVALFFSCRPMTGCCLSVEHCIYLVYLLIFSSTVSAQYTLMSRPYSVGLVSSNKMAVSNHSTARIGIASSHSHRLASAALLRRQASINVTGSSIDIRPRLRRHRTRDDAGVDDQIEYAFIFSILETS